MTHKLKIEQSSNKEEVKTPEIFIVNNIDFQLKSFNGTDSGKSEKNENVYNPFEERKIEHPNSDFGALIHIMKSSMGTGILAMPLAFANAGMAGGVIGTLLVAVICTHCVDILVWSSQELCVRSKTPVLDFSATARVAFEQGPKSLKKFSKIASAIVSTSLCLTYLGSVAVYTVIISSSFQEVSDYYNGGPVMSIQAYMFSLLIILIPLCQIRELKYLVPFSGMANFLLMASISITLYYLFIDLPSISDRPLFKSVSNLPVFFSTAIFAMEGVGVMLPVVNTMKNPNHFLGCPGVLNIGMVVVAFFYTFLGFFGYLRFGDDTAGNITTNLPDNEILAQVSKIFIGLSVSFTFALQLYVPMKIMLQPLLNLTESPKWKNIIEVFFRIAIVVFVVIVAAVVQNLQALIGFVGAIFFSILGIICPAVIETVVRWDDRLGFCYWRLIKNILLVAFAVMTLISGSESSLKELLGTDI